MIEIDLERQANTAHTIRLPPNRPVVNNLFAIPDFSRFVDGLRCKSQRPQFLEQIRSLPFDDVALQQVYISVEIAHSLRERGQAPVRSSGRAIVDPENPIHMRARVRGHEREMNILT